MKSVPPPNSASFDSLWKSPDADEEDLPPALAPSLQGKLVPQEDRDTLIPPMPPGEYVQTMMQLGELYDPMDLPPAPAPWPTPRPALPPPGPGKPLGLVLASEREILHDDLPPRGQPIQPGPRRRSTGSFVAVPPRAEPYYGGAARALPVPRAPSVPPPAQTEADPDIEASPTFEELDTIEGLNSLDGLSPFSTGNTPPGPPVKPGEAQSSWGTPPGPRRDTPPALSVPTSSKPIPTSSRRAAVQDGAAGLRLGKRADAARSFTPAGDSAPRAWPPAAVITAPESEPGVDPPESEPAPSSIHDRAREMTALFDTQSYSSALVLAESVLVSDPGHAPARRCADACRERLTEKYLGNLGGRHTIPRVTMSAEEIRWLSLDHRAGFLLSFIDGSMTLDEVLDVSSMPELDALRILFELRMQGVIEIVEPSRRPGRR